MDLPPRVGSWAWGAGWASGKPTGQAAGGGLDALGQGLGPSGKPPLCSG